MLADFACYSVGCSVVVRHVDWCCAALVVAGMVEMVRSTCSAVVADSVVGWFEPELVAVT